MVLLLSLWRAVGIGTQCWTPPTSRLFSLCRVNFALSKDPEKQKTESEKRNERIRRRRKEDEEWRRKYSEMRCAWRSRRRREDAEYRQAYAEQSKSARLKQQAADPHWYLRTSIFNWCRRYAWVRDLAWKTHVPIFYPEKVEHYCVGCAITRRNGLKLWWKHRNTDKPQFYCHSCYTKDPPAVLPEGYEDVRTMRQLRARKAEFEELESKSQTSSGDDKPKR